MIQEKAIDALLIIFYWHVDMIVHIEEHGVVVERGVIPKLPFTFSLYTLSRAYLSTYFLDVNSCYHIVLTKLRPGSHYQYLYVCHIDYMYFTHNSKIST